jgi:hypothetical protein
LHSEIIVLIFVKAFVLFNNCPALLSVNSSYPADWEFIKSSKLNDFPSGEAITYGQHQCGHPCRCQFN